MAFQTILDEIKNNINKILNDFQVDVPFSVVAAKPGFGDVSCNVTFLLARHLKSNPTQIAQEISAKYEKLSSPLVKKITAHDSGYVNFFADWKELTRLILSESHLDKFGCVNLGNHSTITIEHTSVNPNKALHIGHVRNIVIGDILARIMKKANYKINVLNYIDDSGLQVADIVMGFRYFAFPEEPPNGKKFDQYCGDDVYVKTTAKYNDNPNLKDKRKTILKEIEDGNSETAKFARNITRRVLSSQLETCWNLGVTYDCLNFESQILRSGLWNDIFEKLKDMKLIKYDTEGKNAGCWVFRNQDKVIVRSNGTATYIAKDIPYAAWKLGLVNDPFGYEQYKIQPSNHILWQTTLEKTPEKKNFTGEKVITVIDSRQALLQNIIINLMSEFKSADAYIHLGYESVTLSSDTAKMLGLNTDGKQTQMSGRKGLYVNADTVYDLLKNKMVVETTRRHPDMDESEIENIAHHVAVGTLRYEMIKQDLDKIITFDMTKSLSIEGDTASYIQYTYARASRILEKSNNTVFSFDSSLLSTPAEIELVKMIGMFDIQVSDAARNLSPKVIARYCHNLAVSFNEFYEKIRVLDIDDETLENSRLYLVNSFKLTLERALDLLGIHTLQKM